MSLVFAVVASIVRRWVRIADISFAAVYLIALVSWPFAVVDVAAAPSDSYWLYYIMTIATAMATVGTRHPVRDRLRDRDPGHLRA